MTQLIARLLGREIYQYIGKRMKQRIQEEEIFSIYNGYGKEDLNNTWFK